MNHTITLGGLLLSLSVISGLIICAIGLLSMFAAGMASAPTEQSKEYGRKGCFYALLGLALFVGGLWGLLS